MGLFKKRATEGGDLDRLRAEIAAIGLRVEANDASKQELDEAVQAMQARLVVAESQGTELGERVGSLSDRLDTPMAPPAEPPPATVNAAELDIVRARIERLAQRLDAIDERVTSISTELANQITEISGDLEALGSNAPPADGILDGLRDAQERLANEQARYQIAFRQDLADLAERLKRS